MKIDEIANFEDNKKGLFKELALSSDIGLKAIDNAVSKLCREYNNHIPKESGYIRLFYPGPVLKYENRADQYSISIWTNGGRERHSERLFNYLNDYGKRSK